MGPLHTAPPPPPAASAVLLFVLNISNAPHPDPSCTLAFVAPYICLSSFRVHVLGHSLGGGVAALLARRLRTKPELRARLAGASGELSASGLSTSLKSPLWN